MKEFIKLVRKVKPKKCNKSRYGEEDKPIPFFTEDDCEAGSIKVNIHKDFTIERPKPKKDVKFQGATLEMGRGNFGLRIFFG